MEFNGKKLKEINIKEYNVIEYFLSMQLKLFLSIKQNSKEDVFDKESIIYSVHDNCLLNTRDKNCSIDNGDSYIFVFNLANNGATENGATIIIYLNKINKKISTYTYEDDFSPEFVKEIPNYFTRIINTLSFYTAQYIEM